METQEKVVIEAHKAERKLWLECLTNFRANCESELIRKHEELTKMLNQLKSWIARHGVEIERLDFEELRQVLNTLQNTNPPPEGLIRISELFSASPVRLRPP